MQPVRILHLENSLPDPIPADKILRSAGFEFEKRVTGNCEDFVRALNDFKPDVILSGRSVSTFGPMKALEILQNRGSSIPFILMTPGETEDISVEAMKTGATVYVLKDNIHSLPQVISSAVCSHDANEGISRHARDIATDEEMMQEAELISCSGSFTWDLNANKGRFSRGLLRIFGLPDEEKPSSFKKLFRYLHSEDRPQLRKDISLIRRGITPEKNIYRLCRGETTIKYFRVEYLIKDYDSNRNLYGFIRDMTEMKAETEQLKRYAADLRTILNHTDVAYLLLDREFRVVSYNNQAATFSLSAFGKDLQQGTSGLDYLKSHRRNFVSSVISQLRCGQTVRYETSYNISEKPEWFEVIWTGITCDSGEITSYVFSAKNITERKLNELERERNISEISARNNALEQFTYIVSHNLRSPVANIKGITSLLTEMELAPEDTFLLNGIGESIERVDEVIKDLGQVIHVKNTVTESSVLLTFEDLLDEVAVFIRNSPDCPAFYIEQDFSDVPSFSGIKSYLFSIFYNLISNSIKYRRPEEEAIIQIKALKKGDGIILVFRDNGKGIDLAKNGKMLFGLYKRFDLTIEGRGMGLFMVKTQVEALGGTIEAESLPGSYCQFTINLPPANVYI